MCFAVQDRLRDQGQDRFQASQDGIRLVVLAGQNMLASPKDSAAIFCPGTVSGYCHVGTKV